MGLNASQQLNKSLHIFWARHEIAIAAFLVEGQIQEHLRGPIDGQNASRVTGFVAAHKSFDASHFIRVVVLVALAFDSFENHIGELSQAQSIALLEIHFLLELAHEGQGLLGQIVGHCEIAGAHIGKGHFGALVLQSMDRSPHAKNVLVWLRSQHEHALGERRRPLRPIAVVRIGLSAGPTGDRMLRLIEHGDVQVVGRTRLDEQFPKSMLVIVRVLKLKDGLAHFSRQPQHRLARQTRRPIH